ncbi:MAG: GNAT family N-acetyltransferase [Candidatus Magasanikbacteria bacterium CG10_big_fil_rev_8_21_14_0_10_47_10]|uniref:GNAT family N-acetyltransferase n=1 Tax=Candidatus Magasanikbacteria bacterium CG10_big_fil_rev_8_21_14_0_10_47_10 TaxID=1974652 RepID=A0A2H0TR70_9BACT|nr:MAG: GNAT family N-acetyltransferase [Candidatus Magasanikbacteria bacterium CG10_big_fil_rev_8_21_14_0_10_47_10]
MKIKKESQNRAYAIRFSAQEDGSEVGRAYLYILYNDLHDEPVGLMEDVFVEEKYRGRGIGTSIVTDLIVEAKKQGCRKLIGQSRYGRDDVHALYIRLGFRDHGKNFRMDFI